MKQIMSSSKVYIEIEGIFKNQLYNMIQVVKYKPHLPNQFVL